MSDIVTLRRILADNRTVAVVGLSADWFMGANLTLGHGGPNWPRQRLDLASTRLAPALARNARAHEQALQGLDREIIRAGSPVHSLFAGSPERGAHPVDEHDVSHCGHSASVPDVCACYPY